MTITAPFGAYRTLHAPDRDAYAAHLLRLSPQDRRSRFHAAESDERIIAHAGEALAGDAHVIGWFVDGVLRGAAEVARTGDGQAAEAALEVEEDFRGHGVGGALVEMCLLWARNRGVRRLLVQTTRGNAPMLRAATRNGATFEFDLSEAEGTIIAEPPSLMSHLREATAEQAGLMAWMRQRWLKRDSDA